MALSAARNVKCHDLPYIDVEMKASQTIYAGSLVTVGTDGLAYPGADTSGYNFIGIAMETKTSTAVDGATTIRVVRTGIYRIPCQSTLTQAKVGDLAYVYDSAAMSPTASGLITNSVICGRIVKYESASYGWVDITDKADS